MRVLSSREPGLPPDELIRLATINGARALGLAGKIGGIQTGCFADLIAIPHAGDVESASAAVIDHRKPVAASLISGEWARPPVD